MSSLLIVLLLIVVVVGDVGAAGTRVNSKLLVVMLDGFRWNYFDKFDAGELPGFDKLRRNGVVADSFVPSFPSLSFVNYYSVMTGLYPETHGMIDNYMFDERHGTRFLLGENPDQYNSYWWDGGEPLWITAERQGKRAYFWYWNGCEVQIRGLRPRYCSPYHATRNPSYGNFSLGLKLAVDVLRNGSADLAGVYMEAIDSIGHTYGPESNETRDAILEVDRYLDELLNAVNGSDVNVVVFSDHGMSERVGGPDDGRRGMINILHYITESDWEYVEGSRNAAVLQIWPRNDSFDRVYELLRVAHNNLTVYKKHDIPERYHLKNHYRVPPLYLVADEGYAIVRNASVTELQSVGYHGYDALRYINMHGIFMAIGPDFKRNAKFEVGRLPNVDVYALMCHVLKLVPAPNNGTWSTVCDALADDSSCTTGPFSGAPQRLALFGSFSSCLLIVILAVWIS